MNKLFDSATRLARRRLRRRRLGRYRYVRLRWRVLFAVIDFCGYAIFHLGKRWRRAGRKAVAHRSDPRSILLVQLDHLGDAVITTALLPLLKSRYREATINVLASRRNRELFAACGDVDRVHVARTNRWDCAWPGWWMVTTFWDGLRLRRYRYDMAIDVRGEFPHALILWLSGAARRVGWNSGGGGFLLTDSPVFVPRRAEIESRLALARQLGIDEVGALPVPAFQPSSDARRSVARLLSEHDVGKNSAQPFYVWHVGAGTRAKTWPARHWRELLGRAIVEHNAQVALVGSGQDREAVREITSGLQWPGVIDCTGRLTLAETAAMIESADVFVGCDSGPAHLAAAVSTPTVVLFSGTNRPAQWKPTGAPVTVISHPVACSPCHRARCPWRDHPCMARLEPETVMAKIEIARRATRAVAARRETSAEEDSSDRSRRWQEATT